MQLITVQSSNISQIGFEENKIVALNQKPRNILRIIFNTGLMYDYHNVEKDIFNQFLNAKSKGQFFHKFIKDKYPFEKVS